MAAVAICSDLGAQENKIIHCFHFFPIHLPWSDGTWCHDLCFLMLSFKPAFALSSFTLIKRLFNSFSLSATRGVSSAYLSLLIFLPAILSPACDPSSLAFCMTYSACKLNKESDSIQPCHIPFPSNFSHVQFFVTLLTVACQALLSMGFSRQEYWSELPCPPPGALLTQGLNPYLLCLLDWQVGSLPLVPPGNPSLCYTHLYFYHRFYNFIHIYTFILYFIFLGSKITADGVYSHEIKRLLLLVRKAMTHWNLYIIICETDRQFRFNAWDRVLRAGALGWPWGMGWGGRWEGGSGWGTHVHPWLIHVNVWQKSLQYCKVISLQLN